MELNNLGVVIVDLKIALLKKLSILMVLCVLFSTVSRAQTSKVSTDTIPARGYLSIETAPPYWVLTLGNGFAFSGCISYKLKQNPKIRFGILGYSGRWKDRVRDFLLTDDFKSDNWEAQWNGIAFESHYIFNLGLKRGGLLTGLRTQWNNITYFQNGQEKGTANHIMLTPQVGFQWFPIKNSGLYFLPWAGYMTDLLGTDKINVDGVETNTRKNNTIITFQVGWEFKL
jgi:dihydroflavonol-4-reductase